MVHAVYPGSFDPITNGHLDIIRRALKIFDILTVVVMNNSKKIPMFSIEEREELIRKTVRLENLSVMVDHSDGLLVDYADRIHANVILRGLRAVSDFEFEFQLSLMNRKLNPNIQMMYLMSSSDLTFLSSGLIREVASLGGDVSAFVPQPVIAQLALKFKGV